MTLLIDEDYMSPEGERIGMVIPGWFHLYASRPTAPDNYVVIRRVFVRLRMGGFEACSLIRVRSARKKYTTTVRTFEQDQSVCSTKLP